MSPAQADLAGCRVLDAHAQPHGARAPRCAAGFRRHARQHFAKQHRAATSCLQGVRCFAPIFNGIIYDSVQAVGQCPLCPLKQTFVSALSMSALCQKRTSFRRPSQSDFDEPKIVYLTSKLIGSDGLLSPPALCASRTRKNVSTSGDTDVKRKEKSVLLPATVPTTFA